MKITVKSSEETWRSPDGKIKLYKINLDNGTALQTYSSKIAAGGEFEVETYDKNGNTFVKQVTQENPQQGKQFKADPESRESIEWQKSYMLAVEVLRDYFTWRNAAEDFPKSPGAYAMLVDSIAVHFKNVLDIKPTKVVIPEEDNTEEASEELPPIDIYDE